VLWITFGTTARGLRCSWDRTAALSTGFGSSGPSILISRGGCASGDPDDAERDGTELLTGS
jgi:hypothetical protein